MAALSTDQVNKSWEQLLVEQFAGVLVPLTKQDLKDAVIAANAWVDANSASYVSALNSNAANFAGATNATQKALLLYYVLRSKYNLG